ncbi:MAG TPA: AraC family transcriptional regulator [Frateuria sp.]|uniref:helix-turn-helix transcriptional regulator n=1 Tax=Frateuria sp. TaxID=2211372 RepID=UPI002D7E61A1|nr:AraC family transcriptional regulator [Frateuria sp.]HET6804117.1 AraC family transcriptional regulator [Frateuria sp.]
MRRGAYGDRLGSTFRLQRPPTLLSSAGQPWRLAVTEMQYGATGFGFTDPVVPEDSYLLSLELHGLQHMELWLDGRSVSNRPVVRGGTNFFDLARNPIAFMEDPFHALMFYMPRGALAELRSELGIAPGDLSYRPGLQAQDPVIEQLGRALLAPLHAPAQNQALFVDHVLLALRSHLVVQYSDSRRLRTPPHRCLSARQERCAKELMRAHVREGIALADLAQACGLSASAFVHAFRQSVGVSPHQWLMLQRIEVAMRLMRESDGPLSEIARQSGFADQSHFTRVFTGRMGTTPGLWRKSLPRKRPLTP